MTPSFHDWPDDKLNKAIDEEAAILRQLRAVQRSRRRPKPPICLTREEVVEAVKRLGRAKAPEIKRELKGHYSMIKSRLFSAVKDGLIKWDGKEFYYEA